MAALARAPRPARSFFARPRIVPPPIVSSRSRRASHRRRRAPRVADLLLGRLYVRLRLVGMLGDLVAIRARAPTRPPPPPAPRALSRIVRPGPGSGASVFSPPRRRRTRTPPAPPASARSSPASACRRHHPATETAERDIPDRGAALRPRQLGRDPGGAADTVNVERRCAGVRDAGGERATGKVPSALAAAAAEPALVFDDPDAAKTAIDAKVRECTEKLVACGPASPITSYDSLDEAAKRRRGAPRGAFDGDARLRPVVKTVGRVGSGSNPPAGYSPRRGKTAREAAGRGGEREYTKGVWSRLNGGADGA